MGITSGEEKKKKTKFKKEKEKKAQFPKRLFLTQRLCLKTCNKCVLLNKHVVQVPTRLLGLAILQRVLESA